MAITQEQIDAAIAEEKKAEKAWRDYVLPPNPTTAEGKRKLDLEKKFEQARAKRRKLEQPLRDLEKVREGIKQAENAAKNPVSRDAANKEIARLRREETKIMNQLGGAPTVTTTERTTARTPAGPGVSPDAIERRATGVTVGTPTGPTGPTGPSGTTTGVGTGTGRGRGTGKTKKEKQPKLPTNWEEKFREMFPGQSWLLDLDKTKYPTLFALIQRGVADKMWETPEAQARFAAELDNTDFFTELRNTDKVRTIKSLVGDLGFDQTPFNKFLATASNFGWEGDTLKSEVYKEAFRKDDAGNYVNPTALSRAKKSTDWLKAASIGKQFFTTISDNFIEQRLTGVLTDEDLTRQQRELAKTKFSHLSNLIDQGFTLEELSNSFRQQAAALLERDVNDIDMGSADFEAAYNYGEPGQKRMMTSGEWEILLRSDQKYGWDKTQNAKQEARGLASSIAQAFGRII